MRQDVFVAGGLVVLFIIGGIGTSLSSGQWANAAIARALSATCVSLMRAHDCNSQYWCMQ